MASEAEKEAAEKAEAARVLEKRNRFGDYVQALSPLMRLGHWEIESPDERPDNASAWAQVNCWDSRFGATLRVSDNLLGESAANHRYVAVHELIHCHFAHPDALAQEEMAGKAHAAWTLANEYAIDAVAQVIAPFLPLPSEILDPGKGTDAP